MSEYRLKIARLQFPTKQAIKIDFDVPDDLKAVFDYTPGQHVLVSFKLERDRYGRAYSICSAPGEPYLSICVKRQRGGIVSNYINNAMQVGDTVIVSEPMGDFFDPSQVARQSTVVLWAGGSGITPMRSIARYLLQNSPHTVVELMYFNQDERSTIFHEELRQWQQAYPGRFIVRFRFMEKTRPWYVALTEGWFRKRPEVDKRGQLTHYLAQLDIHTVGAVHYLCGPTGMMKHCKEHLLQTGVGEDDIYQESFGLPLFAEVGHTIATLTLRHQNSQTTHTVSGMTLLDALLAQKVAIPYACRTGSCGTCKARLLAGEVSMMKAFALNNADREKNMILCCQAFAKSETLSIEI